MFTILLVEDDFLNRRVTKNILIENGYHVLEAKDMKCALVHLESLTVNMVILDIHLGEGTQDGINLGEYIGINFSIPFIYLTAYETTDILTRAIHTAPLSYLTKPVRKVDLLACIGIVMKQIDFSEENVSFITVRDKEFQKKIAVSSIDYIESEGNYLLIFSERKAYKLRSTIKQILQLLPTTSFIQTHRAFIVNKKKIEKFGLREILICETVIPVSKNYISDTTKILQ